MVRDVGMEESVANIRMVGGKGRQVGERVR